MEILLAILFIGGGLWTAISPKGSFQFKVKLAKSLGLSISSSPRGFQSMRYIGIAVAVVGFLLYFR